MTEIREALFKMQDTGYRDFHSKLIPSIDANKVIGIRTPALRAYAKSIGGSALAEEFMRELPHEYYDEDCLHGLLISGMKDYAECIRAMNEFLPYVDNWATCDLMSPKSFEKNRDKLIDEIHGWLKSDRTYTVRFGIVMLMTHYLDEEFRPEYLRELAQIRSEEYYIRMAQAWYMATALAKQYDAAVEILHERRLEPWTHNKSIQKARESYRITAEQKEYLRSLKV